MDDFGLLSATSSQSEGDDLSLSTSHLVDGGVFVGLDAALLGLSEQEKKQRAIMDKSAQQQRTRDYTKHARQPHRNFYVPDGKKFREGEQEQQREVVVATRETARYNCSWCHLDVSFAEAIKCPHCKQQYYCNMRSCQVADWHQNDHKLACYEIRKMKKHGK